MCLWFLAPDLSNNSPIYLHVFRRAYGSWCSLDTVWTDRLQFKSVSLMFLRAVGLRSQLSVWQLKKWILLIWPSSRWFCLCWSASIVSSVYLTDARLCLTVKAA